MAATTTMTPTMIMMSPVAAVVAKLEHSDGSVHRVAWKAPGKLEPGDPAQHAAAIVAKLAAKEHNLCS